MVRLGWSGLFVLELLYPSACQRSDIMNMKRIFKNTNFTHSLNLMNMLHKHNEHESERT